MKTPTNNPKSYLQPEWEKELRLSGGARRISFRYNLLNRHDIPIGGIDGITSASISYGEFRAIKRSAKFGLDEYARRHIDYLSDRIQPWFVLHMPGGGMVEWPLGIFLLESPVRAVSGGISTRDIGAYDKTIIVEQDKFTHREFFPKGMNYAAAVTQILNTAGITKIEIAPTTQELPTAREYRIGTKKHLAINELLREINFETLRIDEMGVARSGPYVPPSDRKISHVYDTRKDSIVAPQISESLDIANRPNVFKRVALNIEDDTELVAEFENDDPASPISTVNRGRRIVNYETINEIADQATLNEFVRRIAIESTTAYSHLTFGTALMPTHGDAETLLCFFPEISDVATKFHETGWEMPLVHDGEMRHTARKVVRL